MSARSRLRICALALAAGALTGSPVRAEERPAADSSLARVGKTSTGFSVGSNRVMDVDGDGRDDLVVLGAGGEVRIWRADDSGAFEAKPRGVLNLPRPDRSIVALADVLGDGKRMQLLVLSPAGLVAYPLDAAGGFEPEPVVLAKRARFPLRVGTPRFADMVTDVNSDGRPDVVVPRGETCELWLNEGEGRFRRTAIVPVNLRREIQTRAERLSDRLESSLRVPRLSFEDLNADGRRDLLVEDGKRRAFYVQREDGTIPAAPDVQLDLNIFQDTTPKGEVRLGRTLAGNDNQRFEHTDLDGDGLTDYVIAHRRKVWVFHGTASGPQFERPSTVLKVSEDVTAMLLADLDSDDRPDLLLLRVVVPTVATIIRGLVASWSIEASAIAYRNADGRSFEKHPRPEWQTTVVLELPAIVDILRKPDSFIRRFEAVGKKFRRAGAGDLDANGKPDVALFNEDGDALEVWLGIAAKGDAPLAPKPGELIADVLFKEKDQTWDIDRVLEWLGDEAERQVARITGGRAPNIRHALLDDRELGLDEVVLGDLNGDGRDEIIVSYRRRGVSPETVYEVLSLR